jgi:flagellar basal-body rod modification protein FlgD
MTTPVDNTSAAGNTPASATGQAGLNTDYNSFLKLLTTQLQNQDPLSPMDTNTFTQQLVAMNGVQQQLLTNNLLTTLVSQSAGPTSAVSLIGKQVQAQSSSATLNNGSVAWQYELDGAAAAAQLQVSDSTGHVVYTAKAPDLTKGTHPYTWDGSTTAGGKATAGTYTLKVVANDSNLQAVGSNVFVQGTVTGVSNVGGVAQLNLGTTTVPYSTLTSVTNPATPPTTPTN